MTQVDSTPNPGWWPRFSLLTVLLVMTIAGMAIVIAQLWQEVGPLRAQVRGLRTELGYLNIEDPDKACTIQLPSDKVWHWKWRIYLPPGGKYRFCFYSGTLPSPKELNGKAWFDRVENGGVGSGVSGTMDGGEFTFEAMLQKEGDQWKLVTKGTGGRGGWGGTITQPSGDWLSAREGFLASSALGMREQVTFEPGEPILLLKGLKPIVTNFPGGGGYNTRDPEGAADGFVMWLDQQPALPAVTPKKP